MKKLILLLGALLAVAMPAAVNDVKVTQQKVLSPPTWGDTLVPFESAVTAALTSYRSGMGLGTEDSPAFTGLTLSGLTNTRVVLAGTGGLLGGDADLTFSGTRLTATDLTVTGFPTITAGTATRVPFFTTAGLMTDSASLTFDSGTGALTATSFNGTLVGAAAAGTLTGTTLAANVVTSSLTTVGALNSGSITSGFGSIDVGADSITGGAISGTTGTFSGQISSTATGNIFNVNTATASGRYFNIANTAGTAEFGVQPTGEAYYYGSQDLWLYGDGAKVVTINGSGLNGVIGATTPAAGSFTTLGATGDIISSINFISHATSPYYANDSAVAGTIRYGSTAANSPVVVLVNNSTITTTSSTGLAVTGTLSATGNIFSTAGGIYNEYNGAGINYIRNLDDTSGTTFQAFLKGNGVTIGSIARVTTTDAVAYNTTSDGRLKTNVRDFTAADSGRIIDGLQPRWFDWKPNDLTDTVEETVDSGKVDDKGEPVMEKRAKQQKVTDPARIAKHITDNQSHVGFVAQEEAAVDPLLARIGAVTVGDDHPTDITRQWQRSDSALIPIVIAELKAVRQREAVKDAQIADLLFRVAALEARP